MARMEWEIKEFCPSCDEDRPFIVDETPARTVYTCACCGFSYEDYGDPIDDEPISADIGWR